MPTAILRRREMAAFRSTSNPMSGDRHTPQRQWTAVYGRADGAGADQSLRAAGDVAGLCVQCHGGAARPAQLFDVVARSAAAANRVDAERNDGAITSNMAIVPNGDGKTDAYAAGSTQLILDISGYFAP